MKSLKLASFFALSVLSSVATTTIARRRRRRLVGPELGRGRARDARAEVRGGQSRDHHQDRDHRLERPARARAHGPAVRRGAGHHRSPARLGERICPERPDPPARRHDSRTEQDYVPAAIDYVSWNGKLWAIPYRIETHGVIYNKGDFREAGLDPASRRKPGTN